MTRPIAEILSAHSSVFTEPPGSTPSDHSIDGPLLGNGDLGVAISGEAWHQRFWIAKNDFWKLRSGRRFGGGAAPIGGLDLNLRDLFRIGSYHIEQNLYNAETTGTFTSPERTLVVKSWVSATENVLVVEISCHGKESRIEPELWVASGRGSESFSQQRHDSAIAWRTFSNQCDVPTGAATAYCVVGPSTSEAIDIRSFTLRPGESAVIACPVCSNFEADDFAEAVRTAVAALQTGGKEGISDLSVRHRAWWSRFWKESEVQIDDPLIEKQYYLSQYILASASRNPDFPPPIFGTWITTDNPNWMGDYHLNYNHMAPYYGLYSSNHLEQAVPYDAPILEFADRGAFYAQSVLGTRGVYLPVGIGPKGVETTRDDAPVDHLQPHYEAGGLFFGHKSNASYAVVNMAMRWFTTYDREYAALTYPFIRAVAEFWEDYLTWDGSRFVSESDSIHEGSGTDVNPILSLGLIRCVLRTAVDMSSELGTDGHLHETWLNILENLSDFPVFERNGRPVFRLSEKGVDWWDSNTLAIQHIYPSGCIGPGDDETQLAVSRNTIDELDRWFDGNGMNSLYPAAVRVGYDSEVILSKLHVHCSENLHPNGFTIANPHGIETCSTVPNTINEMLCTSYGGVIRLFHCWPRERDASFKKLRMAGAFLVSGSIAHGRIEEITVHSEQGRDCTIENPWPGETVVISSDISGETKHDQPVISYATQRSETFILKRVQQ